eukprot:m.183302 g.183302  ORF g.183302 m.183302 type:complete len:52 (+) comp32160_c3_seq2:597-752(+)
MTLYLCSPELSGTGVEATFKPKPKKNKDARTATKQRLPSRRCAHFILRVLS